MSSLISSTGIFPKKFEKQISSKELSETIGVVGDEPTTRNYNMQFTFIAWIVCYPPTMKNIKL